MLLYLEYVSIVITYEQTRAEPMRQPDMVGNPARNQLNRENGGFSVRSRLRIWSREIRSTISSYESTFLLRTCGRMQQK